MAYELEKLVDKIKEHGLEPRKGPAPSSDLRSFIKTLEEVAQISRAKNVSKLLFSDTATSIAKHLGIEKSKNRIFQLAKAAGKYVDGVELIKEGGRLWFVFSEPENEEAAEE